MSRFFDPIIMGHGHNSSVSNYLKHGFACCQAGIVPGVKFHAGSYGRLLLWLYQMTKWITNRVLRGEFDNTVEGRTTGRMWLWAMDHPVELELAGDCWRDLAGRRFRFVNPDPDPQGSVEIALEQHGVIGDMTGWPSWLVCERDDFLYCEWFSESDGRVVIELAGLELSVGSPEWEMDESAEGVQRFANAHALRDYLAAVEQRAGEGWSDSEYAALVREVEARYRDYPNAASMTAFVLGLDDKLEAHAVESDRERMGDSPAGICQDAEQLALRAIHVTGSYPDPEGKNEDAVGELFYNLGEMASHLALIFDGSASEDREMDADIRKLLGRCFECHEHALSACGRLIESAKNDPQHVRELEDLRDDVGIMREKLVAVKRQWMEG